MASFWGDKERGRTWGEGSVWSEIEEFRYEDDDDDPDLEASERRDEEEEEQGRWGDYLRTQVADDGGKNERKITSTEEQEETRG